MTRGFDMLKVKFLKKKGCAHKDHIMLLEDSVAKAYAKRLIVEILEEQIIDSNPNEDNKEQLENSEGSIKPEDKIVEEKESKKSKSSTIKKYLKKNNKD